MAPKLPASDLSRLALAGIETLARPEELDTTVEVTVASPAVRAFPPRVSESLGVCLKFGAAHLVQADGQTLEYPADSICVRPPGCVWSTQHTGVAGFVCVDIAAPALPNEYRSGRMQFGMPSEVGDLGRLATLLTSSAPRLLKDEAICGLIRWATRRGVISTSILAQKDQGYAPLLRAREYLENSIGNNPSLQDVAKAAGMNKHVLIRQFRRRFGTTPHAFVLMCKVERARTLLSRGAFVAEVAAALGFADQAHFARTFRKNVGVPPATYQRRVRHSG